ncbi:MAG: GCAxxG family protein [Deltaproteobacteria bacterium]|nr:GCAxxG family protein [Deltaproteobacteria bacterium]
MRNQKTDKVIKRKAYDLGFQYEKVYKGCSQCVLAAVQDLFGERNDDVFRAASGLAGGAGLCGDSGCGGYSGGIMALSQLHGRVREKFLDPERTRRKSFDLAKKLHDKFIAEYGSVICRDIQQKILGRGYYLRDPEEFEKFEKAGAHAEKCPSVVGNAAKWVAEILWEEGNRPKRADKGTGRGENKKVQAGDRSAKRRRGR